MTAFETADAIRNYMARQAGDFLTYKSWSDAFCREQLNEAQENVLKQLGRVDVTTLTTEECDSLKFGRWDEETGLRLLPVWLYPFLAFGQELISIDGDKTMVGKTYTVPDSAGYVDNDTRFGCLAYGIIPAK